MDILAHSLWTGALAKLSNKARKSEPTKPLIAAFWGIFPDLFAFTHLFSYLILMSLFGNGGERAFFGRPDEFEPPHNGTWVFHLTSSLYQLSHSLIIFVIVFAIVWWIRKKPYYELLGWLLHILIDIPTHSYDFYPTPLLWPISSWKFEYGISWATSWFMKLNYLSLVAVYLYLLITGRRKGNSSQVSSF